ncbi:chromosome partitioning protein [Gammaproteobacteria bacterium]
MNPELPDLRPTPEIITVVGTFNGAGKTTTSMNLAVAFAASGRSILLIDLDSRGSIGGSLIRGWYEDGGSSRLFTNTAITREMIAATEIPDLFLLPSEEGLNAVEQHLTPVGDSRTRLAQSLETLRSLSIRFDLVLVNCPSNLSLITLNALVAAHWVLIPISTATNVPADSGLSTLLTTIQRIRGGMKQPLRGVYLLPTLQTDTKNALVSSLRNGYGPMTLALSIPWSQKVIEAGQYGKPVLVYAPHDPVSAAYLDLATKWLELINYHGASPDAPRQFFFPVSEEDTKYEGQYHSKDSALIRQVMEKRILAWLIDPSCLLYDVDEAKRQPEPRVLEELIQLTRQNISASKSPLGNNRERLLDSQASIPANNFFIKLPFIRKTWNIRRWLFLVLVVIIILISLFLFIPPLLRFELAALLIGRAQYWDSGSTLLFRADEIAYRELILGAKMVGNNRAQIFACGEEAQAKGAVVICPVAISPE